MSYNSYLQVITLKLCFHETDMDADADVGRKKIAPTYFLLSRFHEADAYADTFLDRFEKTLVHVRVVLRNHFWEFLWYHTTL